MVKNKESIDAQWLRVYNALIEVCTALIEVCTALIEVCAALQFPAHTLGHSQLPVTPIQGF